MDQNIIDEEIIERLWLEEEDGSALMAAECLWRGITDELQELHNL